MDTKELAAEIKRRRVAAGLRQTDLAKMLGTGQSRVCQLESAVHGPRSVAILCRIGLLLGFTVELRDVAESDEGPVDWSASMTISEPAKVETDSQ